MAQEVAAAECGDINAQLDGVLNASPINFEAMESTIKSGSLATLDQVASIIAGCSGHTFEVQGHTDSGGTNEANLELSQARAQAVVDYLVSKGVAAEQLTAKGYGEEQPVAPNDSPSNRALNRRVEIVVIA
ncbi:MAG: OmpA family protein [Ilumatobacteraceae bacterium]